MLFSVAFIFCLFVGATSRGPPVAGEIVLVRTSNLGGYYEHIDLKKFDKNSYRLAVFVSHSNDNKKYGSVVPVIPKNAPSNIFPKHLRQDVMEYFINTNSRLQGFGTPRILEGDFDLAAFQPVHRLGDLRLSSSNKPTMMSNNMRQKMITEFQANLDRQGMPQLPLKDVDLRRADAGNTDPLKIQPGQVVEFKYGKPTSNVPRIRVRGVAVCWTGQGKMAIIAILKELAGSDKSQKIDGSDFSGESKPTSGEFELTKFRFVQYEFLYPQSATFNNKVKFDSLVDTIEENMEIARKAAMEIARKEALGVPGGGSSSGRDGMAAGPSSGVPRGGSSTGSNKASGAAPKTSPKKTKGIDGPDWRQPQGVNAPTWRGNGDQSGAQSPRVPKWESSSSWRPDNKGT